MTSTTYKALTLICIALAFTSLIALTVLLIKGSGLFAAIAAFNLIGMAILSADFGAGYARTKYHERNRERFNS